MVKNLALIVCLAGSLVSCSNRKNGTTIRWLTDPNPVRQKQVALFESLNPGIHVELDTSTIGPPGSGLRKALFQLAAGNGPDLIDVEDGTALRALVATGKMARLSGILDISDCWPQFKLWCMVGNETYAVPAGCVAVGIYINKRHLEEAGLQTPPNSWTWNDFLFYAHKMTTGGHFGFQPLVPNTWWQWLWQADGHVGEALKFLYDLTWLYQVSPTPQQLPALSASGRWASNELGLFMAEKISMVCRGREALSVLGQRPDLDWVFVPPPRGRKAASTFMARAAAVNIDSKNLVEAVQFIKFMASDKYRDLTKSLYDSEDFGPDIAHPESAFIGNAKPTPIIGDDPQAALGSIYEVLDAMHSNAMGWEEATKRIEIELADK